MYRAGFLFFCLLSLLYYSTATGCIARKVEPVLHVVDVGHKAADLKEAHHDCDVFVVEVVGVSGALGVFQINIPQISNNAEVILSVAVRHVAILAYQLLHLVQKLGTDVGVGRRWCWMTLLWRYVVRHSSTHDFVFGIKRQCWYV